MAKYNMAKNISFARDAVLDKEMTLHLGEAAIDKSFENSEFPEGETFNVLKRLALSNFKKNVDIIFTYAESPIETIFLNSINIFAYLINPGVALIFMDPSKDITTSMKGFIGSYKKSLLLYNEYLKKYPNFEFPEHFMKWVESLTDMIQEDKELLKYHILFYKGMGLDEVFHVSIQSTIKNITINKLNVNIRPDILVWLPSNEELKLIVECDGYSFHSDKSAFSRDRTRDRALNLLGYTVLRYSGSEIFNNPLETAYELGDHLSKIYESLSRGNK